MKNSKLKNVYAVTRLDSLRKGEIISVNEQLVIRGGQAAIGGWQPLCTVNGGCTINNSCGPQQPTQPTTTIIS